MYQLRLWRRLPLETTAQVGGAWTETVLHSFQGGTDGYVPWGRVFFGRGGQLYGTTQFGGLATCDFNGCGTVFAVAP